jgi:cytochrome c-type biogenesis protein CcmE
MNLKLVFSVIGIVVCLALIFTTASESSEYVGFETAFTRSESGDTKQYHVIGELMKGYNQQPVIRYDPHKDPNYLSFDLVDNQNKVRTVVTHNPPASMQDFARSEKVVVIGKAQGDVFLASEILMKCPSKYEGNQNEIQNL